MNPDDFNNTNDNEDEMPKLDLRQENEFKKMKMTLESGAVFPENFNREMPPEIESQFLDSIMHFENIFKNAKKIVIFDKIGQPNFIPENVLNDDEVEAELDKLFDLLNENGVNLSVLADYDDEIRLIYNFITQELVHEKIDDFGISGYSACFTYEDFHPNNDYDLRELTHDFLRMFLDKENKIYKKHYSDDASNSIEINAFRSMFKKFKLKIVEILSIEVNEDKAKSVFNIEFSGKMKKSKDTFNFIGQGEMTFKHKNSYWHVREVKLPINK